MSERQRTVRETVRTINGLRLACLEAGEGPLVLVLHGFPDTAESFRPLLGRLAGAGYHGLAPFLRGYAPSDRAADGDYRLGTLAEDVRALIHEVGAERAALVGHDWGAAIGYTAAALFPERLSRLVACSVPHLWRFLSALPGRQGWRSRYMLFFQLRGIAERRLRANHDAALIALMRRWSPGWAITEADLAPLRRAFDAPGGLSAALAYYRQLPGEALRRFAALRRPIPVPTTVIHGAQDGCIGPEVFQDQSHLFAAGLRTVCLPQAGHFLINEAPEAFCEAVLGALAGP